MGDLSLRSAARWTTRALLLVLFNFISAAPMAVVSAQDSAVTSPAPTVASTDDTVPIFVKFRSGTAPSEIDAAMRTTGDRKSTRLNSSHRTISYAVFCLK